MSDPTPRRAWLSLAHAAPAALDLWAALRQAEPDLERLGQRLAATLGGDDHAFADIGSDELRPGPPARIRNALRSARVQRAVDAALERTVEVPRHRLLTPADADYPERLASIDDASPMLALTGVPAALDLPPVAIVGARRASRRGLDAATELGRDIAQSGFSVVSGLAIGIDAAAHRGALAADGCTVAVMATGADRLYPPRHARLAEQITERGALLSEFPLGFVLDRTHFPIRNRLVSALAYGVVLIEARWRSGTLTTATHARRQNRDVMVVPGAAGDPAWLGGHALLEDGAVPVSCARDVLACVLPAVRLELAVEGALTPRPSPDSGMCDDGGALPSLVAPGSDAARTLAALDPDSSSLDRIAGSLPFDTARLLAALSLLEACGLAARDLSGGYSRCLCVSGNAKPRSNLAPRSGSARATRGSVVEPGVDDAHAFDLD